MTISDEAVEAAAATLFRIRTGRDFSEMTGGPRHLWVDEARQALIAAAPHLMAQAWDEGADSAWENSGEGWNGEYPRHAFEKDGNPYRHAGAGE